MGNILYSQDTARSCSHPNYELWSPASDIKESKIVEMLLGHNFSPQSKFFVVENRGKAVAIFLQRNEKIGEKTVLLSLPPRQTLWSLAYLTPLKKVQFQDTLAGGLLCSYFVWWYHTQRLYTCSLRQVSHPIFIYILSQTCAHVVQ